MHARAKAFSGQLAVDFQLLHLLFRVTFHTVAKMLQRHFT